jgi:hypothetical protein
MRHSEVEIHKNTVVKRASPHLMRIEIEKTRQAHEIGKASNLFQAPQVLDFEEATGKALFERIHGLRRLSEALPWRQEYRDLIEVLARSLVLIHQELVLPDDMRLPLPPQLNASHDLVFLHGDLTVDNVCINTGTGKLVILDWQLTPLYGGQATFGTRYFDVLWFLGTLINRPRMRFLVDNPVAPIASSLISRYLAESRVQDYAGIAAYAQQFFRVELPRAEEHVKRNSWGRARLLWPRSAAIARALVAALQQRS